MGNPITPTLKQTQQADNQNWVVLVAGVAGRRIRLHGYTMQKQSSSGPSQIRLRWSGGKILADHRLLDPTISVGTPFVVGLGDNYYLAPTGESLEYRQEDAPVAGPGANDILLSAQITIE